MAKKNNDLKEKVISSTKVSIIGKIANTVGVNRKFSKFGDDNWIDDNSYIISPVDGKVVACGEIKEDGNIISKSGKEVILKSLIGEYDNLFIGGTYLNIYLSPKNKHYWRIPYKGQLVSTSLNQGKAKIPVFIGLDKILKKRDCFRRAVKKNASVGLIFKADNLKFAMIPVGSLNVNGIHIIGNNNGMYKKGDIGGYFSIGSSMLLCFPKNSVEILIKIKDEIKIGENIIKLKK